MPFRLHRVDSLDENEGNAEISESAATSSSSDRSEDDDCQAVDKIHTRKKAKDKQKKKQGTSGCFPSVYEHQQILDPLWAYTAVYCR